MTDPARFDRIAAGAMTAYAVRVRRWRRAMTGAAWQVYHPDGRVERWVEAPRPRSPLSLSILLHEVGHHAVGFEHYRRRCEEEYHAWRWAIDHMPAAGVDADARVLRRFDASMRYAVDKAVRRGLRIVPAALRPFQAAA